MTKCATEKFRCAYVLSNSCLTRYIFYVLLIFATAVCVANLICLQERLSRTHPTWNRRHGSRYNYSHRSLPIYSDRHDTRSVRCSKFGSTMRNLEEIASQLDDTLHNITAQEPNEKRGEKRSSDRSVFRYNIVIMAYKRSGSSFVGQLFNHHPDVLYLYEPLYFLKELAQNHGNAYRLLSRQLLNTIFTCNFEENPYFVSQLSDSAFRLSSRVLSEPPMCPNTTDMDQVHNQCKRIHTSTLIDICQSHRRVVIKSIRVKNLDELRELGKFNIEAPWNILKIIHLVRDPRAIINSRAHIDLTRHSTKWTKAEFKANARALCAQILENLKEGVAGKSFTGMYHVIRYEDIVMQTERATRRLYEFANLPWSDKVARWLRKNTKKKHESYAFSTTKNATVSLNQWRIQNDLKTIRIVEQECSIIMALLGYIKVRNRDHLLNFSQPLFLDNKANNIFMTRNINETLLEIENLKNHGLL